MGLRTSTTRIKRRPPMRTVLLTLRHNGPGGVVLLRHVRRDDHQVQLVDPRLEGGYERAVQLNQVIAMVIDGVLHERQQLHGQLVPQPGERVGSRLA